MELVPFPDSWGPRPRTWTREGCDLRRSKEAGGDVDGNKTAKRGQEDEEVPTDATVRKVDHRDGERDAKVAPTTKQASRRTTVGHEG